MQVGWVGRGVKFLHIYFQKYSCKGIKGQRSEPSACISPGGRRPPGSVQCGPGTRGEQGARAEEDSPDVAPVEDHEQQTVWRVLPEQLRMLHGTLQVSQEQEVDALC